MKNTEYITLPDSLFPKLPNFLNECCRITETKHERDMMLLGSIVTISACLNKVYGYYRKDQVFPNLFLYVSAPPSAGKGKLVYCKRLVYPIHNSLRKESEALFKQFEIESKLVSKSKGKLVEPPQKPKQKLLFIPANSSSSGLLQLLQDNQQGGLIFETEGDTLANIFKTDFGNYSDSFRKVFHHESIQLYRKSEKEYIEVQKPKLSTVLSGTPRQVSSLIPDCENGLFSRFAFYLLPIDTSWSSAFDNHLENLEEHYDHLGALFYSFYCKLSTLDYNIQFRLEHNQKKLFDKSFFNFSKQYEELGDSFTATVRRQALITFRICMSLSASRYITEEVIPKTITCKQEDLEVAVEISRVLLEHSRTVFQSLPKSTNPFIAIDKMELFSKFLPNNFNREQYVSIGKEININSKNCEYYIKKLLDKGRIVRVEHNSYTKIL